MVWAILDDESFSKNTKKSMPINQTSPAKSATQHPVGNGSLMKSGVLSGRSSSSSSRIVAKIEIE